MRYQHFELSWFVWLLCVPGLVHGLPAEGSPFGRLLHEGLDDHRTQGPQDTMDVSSPCATESGINAAKAPTDVLHRAGASAETSLDGNIDVNHRLNASPITAARSSLQFEEFSVRPGERDAFRDIALPDVPIGDDELASVRTIGADDFPFKRPAVHQGLWPSVVSPHVLAIAASIVLTGLGVGWVCDSFLLHP
ncbi:hypothetical protein C8Q78DRAFT_280871 [Trametes maxima]|nr:hypothetical protein C8Q78DRAFT_280871 [Trametes maxima]